MLTSGHGQYALQNARTKELLALRLEGAFDSASRRKGLLGRDAMPADTALAIAPCNAIHMFFMRFPIDVVFVSKQGRIRKISRNVKPWRMSVSPGAFAVIELAAHAVGRTATAVGDHLELVSANR